MTSTIINIFAALIKQDDLPNIPGTSLDSDTLKQALQIVFGVIAVTAIIFIIISAIRYSTSIGNPQATEKLRNSIIYAAIGLVVALSAEAIVTFTLGRI